ncbi:MAG: DUF2330 domain-containing protein, partial [Phycisphaerales bacterium]|nr:DUF2330 domain-containing protein [Phycisphaerales bacterium]
MMIRRPLTAAAAALGVAALSATLLAPRPAQACGGFFCNQTPVNQEGEHILFAMENGQIEAHVLVNYVGGADDFAWIVPTPSLPEVGVSTATLFTRLEQVVGPRFWLEWTYLGDCDWGWGYDDADSDGLSGAGGAPTSEDPSDRGVNVIESSQVGPYDYTILQATDVEVLFEWLHANGYDIPDLAQPAVEPYVVAGGSIHFVAFKLSKDSDVGDIQPIRLRYDGEQPMIPIQLTAIASEPDMGVTVNILDANRMVPENYLHVHINEARIDWLNGGWNYDDVVTEAMNEAGGQAFTTEYAGVSSVMDGQLVYENQFDIDRLRGISDPIEFFRELQNQGFSGDQQLMGLLQTHIPMPTALEEMGVTPRDFYNCLDCYA